jgi:hypothetical protein
MDNRSGIKTQQMAPEAFCQMYSELHAPFNSVFTSNSHVQPDSASVGWMWQMAHMSKIHQNLSSKRVIFGKNFYTQHNLASA